MKKIILYLLFTLNCISLSQAQQNIWINPQPSPYRLYDVFFADDLNGWAVGEFSTAIKTNDGGNTWIPVDIPLRATLHRVYFTDKNNGWIVGGDPIVPSWGAVLKTTDGGISWVNYQPNPQHDYSLLDISITAKDTGYIAGFEGIFKTTNGGESWFNTGGTTWGTSVYFINSVIGWATNSTGKILKTTNGGITWNVAFEFHWKWHKRIKFYNEETGWVVSRGLYDDYGTIHKTTNGGYDWVLQDSVTIESYYDIEIIDSLNLIVVGENGFIKYSTDGGESWFNSSTNNWDPYYGIALKGDEVWIVGGNYNYPVMFKSKLNDLRWELQSQVLTSEELTSLDFVAKNNGWISGLNGSLFFTTDGGENWISKELFNIDFGGISIPDENHIYVAGNSGEFVRSSDGGQTWITSTIRPQGYFGANHKIKFFTSSIGFSSLQYDALLKTSDGGETWHNSIYPIQDFFFIDSLNGWIFNNYVTADDWGYIRKTSDGGETWGPEITIPTYISSIFFLDELTGWYSNGYVIYKTTNSGYEWNLVNNYNGYGIIQMVFVSDKEGYFVATDEGGMNLNVILKTSDGGQSFNKLQDLTLVKTFSVISENIFAVGEGGQIIKVNKNSTDVKDDDTHNPTSFILQNNFPNPFNPTTTIRYNLPHLSDIKLVVYDILGNEITTLVDEEKSAGFYEVNFNASDLASGIYFYQLKAGDFIQTKKMILLK